MLAAEISRQPFFIVDRVDVARGKCRRIHIGRVVDHLADGLRGHLAPAGDARDDHVVLLVQQPVELLAAFRRRLAARQRVRRAFIGRNRDRIDLDTDRIQRIAQEDHLGVQPQRIEGAPLL